MKPVLRLAINGASGRMGQSLLSLLDQDARFELMYAVVSPQSSHVGAPVFPHRDHALRYSQDWAQAPALDVIIDFSSPEAAANALQHAVANSIALVSGTTGFDHVMEGRLADAGKRIPILRAANFSVGVAVLTRLLREAAGALAGWDLEIVEAHHGRKRDAPSGTALTLGQAAASGRQTTLDEHAVYSRDKLGAEREQGSIGFAVVRGGDIVGEHSAMLIGKGERLELAHRATDRSIFARGALQAAAWLAGQPAGAWALDDAISSTP